MFLSAISNCAFDIHAQGYSNSVTHAVGVAPWKEVLQSEQKLTGRLLVSLVAEVLQARNDPLGKGNPCAIAENVLWVMMMSIVRIARRSETGADHLEEKREGDDTETIAVEVTTAAVRPPHSVMMTVLIATTKKENGTPNCARRKRFERKK